MNRAQTQQIRQVIADMVLDQKLVWYSGDKKIFVGKNDAKSGVWNRVISWYDRDNLIGEVMKHTSIAPLVTVMILESNRDQAFKAILNVCFDNQRPLFRKELMAEIIKRGDGCMAIQAETKVMIWQREGQELQDQVTRFKGSLTAKQFTEFQDIISKIENRMRASEGGNWR